MNKLTKIVAVVLILAAAGLAILAWSLGRQPAKAPPTDAAPAAGRAEYPAVVAAHKLEPGKPITADSVMVTKLPIALAGTYSNIGEVAGKAPAVAIGAGALLTEAMFARGVALQLMPGERAMAVPVDEVVGAGNRIVPGDHVDVFFTLKEGQDISKTQSRLLASRLRVLSYGAATVASDPSATADGNGGNGANTAAPAQRTVARTAVLAVPVEQVNRVVLATQSGKLLLALRNPSDETLPDLALFPEPGPALAGKAGLSREQQDLLSHPDNRAFAGIELTGLAGETGAPQRQASARTTKAPARSRQGSAPYTVEVIRGTQREAVAY